MTTDENKAISKTNATNLTIITVYASFFGLILHMKYDVSKSIEEMFY